VRPFITVALTLALWTGGLVAGGHWNWARTQFRPWWVQPIGHLATIPGQTVVELTPAWRSFELAGCRKAYTYRIEVEQADWYEIQFHDQSRERVIKGGPHKDFGTRWPRWIRGSGRTVVRVSCR